MINTKINKIVNKLKTKKPCENLGQKELFKFKDFF